jgi:predicted signal transduction protein with EAL and GGDEF domain
LICASQVAGVATATAPRCSPRSVSPNARAKVTRPGPKTRLSADLGIRISIDDFGSGYTSLAYLRTLPIDALKIDRILITDLIDDKGLAVTKSIIDLGHALGLSVLAEGVETEVAWRQLELLGCDEIQGYLFARPMPAGHIEGWIRSHQDANQHLGEPPVIIPLLQ